MNTIERKDYGLAVNHEGKKCYRELVGTVVNGESMASMVEVVAIDGERHEDLAVRRATALRDCLSMLKDELGRRLKRDVEIVEANDPAGVLFQWK